MKRILFLILCGLTLIQANEARADGVLDTYPGLKKFVSSEKASNLYFGFGVNPLNTINGNIGFSASLFQVHWINEPWDIEVFNGTFGSVFGNKYGSEQYFIIRTAPKYRVFKNISVGPVLGAEFIHFPGVTERLSKDLKEAPVTDFSTVGTVYGFTISEVFPIGDPAKNSLLRISETLYKENYSTTGTNNGWTYDYQQPALNSDQSPIAASTIFSLEISYLF